MSVNIQINNIDGTPNGDLFVEGVLLPTGNYPNGVGGDVVDFTGVNSVISFGPAFTGPANSITSSFLKQLWVGSLAGTLGFQYVGNVVTGANAPSGARMKVSQLNTFGTELGSAPYPAGVTADTIGFQATFKKNL